MYNRFALGIDGGASKVLTQLFTINKNNEIIDQSEPFEQSYKDVDTFNHQFIPVPLNTQNEEMNNENYKIGFNEKGQSKVIIKAIIESIKYFKKSVEIVRDIHEKNILHRDIKPDNFMIKERNGIKDLYAIDFGLAKRRNCESINV